MCVTAIRGTASTKVYMPTRKFGGGGVMVWRCFSSYGVGLLVVIRGTMNSQEYCTIIMDNEMLSTLWHLYVMDPCYFQDDNDCCHVSEATMQW